MKLQSVIILFAIALTIAFPPSFQFLSADHHREQAEIGALDVCHSTTPTLSSNGDMPCVHIALCILISSPVIVTSHNSNQPFTHFILSLQDERPPKA